MEPSRSLSSRVGLWIVWLGSRLAFATHLPSSWFRWRRVQACTCANCATQRMAWATYRAEEWWQARSDLRGLMLGMMAVTSKSSLNEVLEYAMGNPPEGWQRRARPGCLNRVQS